MSSPYRSDSLDSLVSSDDLDQASSLIRFRSFLFLVVFAILLSLGVLCCIFIEVPIKVSGPSVVWSNVGVLQVAAKDPGSVHKITVEVGDHVERGQIIAELNQTRIISQYKETIKKMEALEKYVSAIEKLRKEDQEKREGWNEEMSKLAVYSMDQNDQRKKFINKRRKTFKELLEDEMITKEQYDSKLDQLYEVNQTIITNQRMMIVDQKEDRSKFSTEERERFEKILELERLQSEIELLHQQLADEGKLNSPLSGRVIEVTTSVGDYLSPGSPVILVQPDPDISELTFFTFISSEQVKPVKLGMRTELELSAFPSTKYGKLVAEVTSISPIPLSSSALMKVLRNDHLVERITQDGSPFKIGVKILKDSKTGDLLWSSASDAKRELQVGMVGEGSIITRHERLVWLLLPQTE